MKNAELLLQKLYPIYLEIYFVFIQIIDRPGGGAMFAMEYLDMGRGLSKYAATLGEQLGR